MLIAKKLKSLRISLSAETILIRHQENDSLVCLVKIASNMWAVPDQWLANEKEKIMGVDLNHGITTMIEKES